MKIIAALFRRMRYRIQLTRCEPEHVLETYRGIPIEHRTLLLSERALEKAPLEMASGLGFFRADIIDLVAAIPEEQRTYLRLHDVWARVKGRPREYYRIVGHQGQKHYSIPRELRLYAYLSDRQKARFEQEYKTLAKRTLRVLARDASPATVAFGLFSELDERAQTRSMLRILTRYAPIDHDTLAYVPKRLLDIEFVEQAWAHARGSSASILLFAALPEEHRTPERIADVNADALRDLATEMQRNPYMVTHVKTGGWRTEVFPGGYVGKDEYRYESVRENYVEQYLNGLPEPVLSSLTDATKADQLRSRPECLDGLRSELRELLGLS